MKMPAGCWDCRLRFDGYCVADSTVRYMGSSSETPKERPQDCPISEPEPVVNMTSVAIFDQEEIHENCTVQVWKNSVTGECSVGWWENL